MECGKNELIPVILATIVTGAIVFRRWRDRYNCRRFWKQIEEQWGGKDKEP